jgi:hypothetical protein
MGKPLRLVDLGGDRAPDRALAWQETANASGAHFCEGDLLADRFGHVGF